MRKAFLAGMAARRGHLGVKKGLKRATLKANGKHISDCSIQRLARRGGAPPAAVRCHRREALPLQYSLASTDSDISNAWLQRVLGERSLSV